MLSGIAWLATTVVFLNFDGAEIRAGGEDAALNQSQVLGMGATARKVPAFDAAPYAASHSRAQAISAVLSRTGELFGGYDVTFTATRPAEGPYTMVVIGGRPSDLHREARAEDGIAVVDCDNQSASNVAFVWSGVLTPGERLSVADSIDEIAVVAAHELGHAFGLEHVTRTNDVMHPGRVERRTGFFGMSPLADGASVCTTDKLQDSIGRLGQSLGAAHDEIDESDIGASCQAGSQCGDGVCVKMNDWGFCSRTCQLGSPASCPTGSSCSLLSGAAYCMPDSTGGCALGGASARAEPRAATLLLLLLVLGLAGLGRLRRRARA